MIPRHSGGHVNDTLTRRTLDGSIEAIRLLRHVRERSVSLGFGTRTKLRAGFGPLHFLNDEQTDSEGSRHHEAI